MDIGISTDRYMIFEGDGHYGHAVWPTPVVSVATIIESPSDYTKIPDSLKLTDAKNVFREDSFDPVTRIRRGRFYTLSTSAQPSRWFVTLPPGVQIPEIDAASPGIYKKVRLVTYHGNPFSSNIKDFSSIPVVALGDQKSHSTWNVVGIERIANNEELVTLRARSSLGTLPEINPENIPEKGRGKVLETIEKLADTIYRAGPESVVDRCRDAASAILGCFMAQENKKFLTIDLGHLINVFEKHEEWNKKAIVISAARIIARLHPRCKPNEQENHDFRQLIEQDGELAVQCVAAMLNDLGFSKL